MMQGEHQKKKNNVEEILRDNILASILETIIDICRDRNKIFTLINESKEGQLGKRRLIEIMRDYNADLLDALNQISRLYENPVKAIRSVFGAVTPSAAEIKSICDGIIIQFVNLYIPEEVLPIPFVRPSAPPQEDVIQPEGISRAQVIHEATGFIRAKLMEYVATNEESCVIEIMQRKRQAGIINTGESGPFCHELNLSNLDLTGMDLSGRWFKLVSFDNSRLCGTKLNDISRCTFINANLTNAIFTGYIKCDPGSFKNADLAGAHFIGVDVEDAMTQISCKSNGDVCRKLVDFGAVNIDRIVFKAPASPKAQPRNIVAGNPANFWEEHSEHQDLPNNNAEEEPKKNGCSLM